MVTPLHDEQIGIERLGSKTL